MRNVSKRENNSRKSFIGGSVNEEGEKSLNKEPHMIHHTGSHFLTTSFQFTINTA